MGYSNCNFTTEIDENDCIGDTLDTINANFSALEIPVCDLVNDVSNLVSGVATLVGIRLSLHPTTPTPTTDRTGTNANTLYVHPFRGNIVTLWDTASNKWIPYTISSILSFPLNCPAANTNYDIYLSRNSSTGVFSTEFVQWSTGSSAGTLAPTRIYKDGIAVKSLSEPSKRLVGCLRTVAANQSEQSFGGNVAGGANCRQFLWNAQNQIPVTCYSFETGQYNAAGDSTGWTGWRRVNPSGTGSGLNNRFSFIVGENTLVTMISQIYASYYANLTQVVSYTAIGINSDTAPTLGAGSQMVSELRGSDMTPRAQLLRSFSGSFNYLQMFENIHTGAGTTVIMNENHQNQTGYLVSLFN